jgi:hypothetical protein
MAEVHKMGSKGCKCDDNKEYLQFYCGDSCSCCDSASASLSQGKNADIKITRGVPSKGSLRYGPRGQRQTFRSFDGVSGNDKGKEKA